MHHHLTERELRSYRDLLVLRALDSNARNRRRAAIQLGISLRTICHWLADMRKRGVSVPPRGDRADRVAA